MYLKVMDILRYKRIVKKEEKLMELYEVKNTRISSGGGTRKYLYKKSSRLEDNVVLQLTKGGVKLDNALTRGRL